MDIRQQVLDGDTIRHELIKQYNRATTTSTDDVDLLAIDLFASMVHQYESLITFDATKIIAEKFHSKNADEVLLALNVLEECMSKCGPKFHNEVGKFRFLNELIRLVSPQYEGNNTPKKIRDKILDLLLLWTINHPQEKKIKEAYDMLLKRGVQHEYVKAVTIQNPSNSKTNNGASSSADVKPRERAEPDLAAKLKGLLQSANPSDHKAANLLIQNMVKEKERRDEVKIRRKLELREIIEKATLLKEMLEELEKNSSSEEVTEDILATLQYLYESCDRLRPTIMIITGDVNETECIEEALETNDLLSEVFQKYDQLIRRKQSNGVNSCLISTQPKNTGANNTTAANTMDELNEIFSSGTNYTDTSSTLVMATTPLQPTQLPSVPKRDSDDSWQVIKDLNNASQSQSPLKVMSPTASLAMNNSLEDLLHNSNSDADTKHLSKTTSISMTADKPNAIQTKFQNLDSEIIEMISGLKSNLIKDESPHCIDVDHIDGSDDDKLILDSEPDAKSIEDDVPIGLLPSSEAVKENSISNDHQNNSNVQANANKALADMYVDLNSIQPHDSYASRSIFEEKNGLKIILNFTKDKPRADVTVLVITTINHNSLPIANYHFDASVPKPCKLHLQKPSGYELPGIKPFRPPTEDITQIMLIANAERKPLKLVCIISYNLGDDPDPVKEFLEINDLPDLFG